MGFKHVFSSSYWSGHRRGVATLISGRMNYEHILEMKDKEGRYSLIRGKLDGMLITILNIYAPPGSQWQFYKQMFDLMATETDGILLGGRDLNVRLTGGVRLTD